MIEALIVEDEVLSARRLQIMLDDLQPGIKVKEVIGTLAESINWLSENSVDLIFQDVQLSDGISTGVYRNRHWKHPVIFTSAHDNHIKDAVKFMCVDYLLKPYSKEDLEFALDKYFRLFRPNLGISLYPEIQRNTVTTKYRKRFLVKVGRKLKSIQTKDIAFFYSEDKGTYLKTKDNKKYPLDVSLNKILTMLDPLFFFRINRYCITSIDAVDEIYAHNCGRWLMRTQPEGHIPFWISVDRLSACKEWLNT